jgi:ureidoglycolate hydrolase
VIEKIVYLWCDRCHTIGPSGDTIKSVRRAAKRLGWLIEKPTERHPHSTPATCPLCVAATALVVAP